MTENMKKKTGEIRQSSRHAQGISLQIQVKHSCISNKINKIKLFLLRDDEKCSPPLGSGSACL